MRIVNGINHSAFLGQSYGWHSNDDTDQVDVGKVTTIYFEVSSFHPVDERHLKNGPTPLHVGIGR